MTIRMCLAALLALSMVFVGCDQGGDAGPGALDEVPVDDYGFIGQGEPDQVPPVVEEELHAVALLDPSLVEVVIPQVGNPLMEDQLTIEEQARIDILRTAIEQGLDMGRLRYLEEMTLALQDMGVIDDYESLVVDVEADDVLDASVDECPFAKFYDNGFEPTGLTCDYLADMAKVEVYSELTKLLAESPLPASVIDSDLVTAEEAEFWYEQGTISGIEEHRILVRSDLKVRGLCSKDPTPVQSSHDKGIVVGRQLYAEHFNKWLQNNGYVADYPEMSQKIQVCNADQTMLEPAFVAAQAAVPLKLSAEPLCPVTYQAPDFEAQLQYAQAEIDYQAAMEWGIQDEFLLAGVRVFQVIPCNVGDPIVMDLDGDGVELLPIQDGVNFDLWAAGHPQAMAWVHPDDGFLIIDRNSNGRVDDGAELFGNVDGVHEHGFDHLAALDTDGDRVLTATDEAFAELRIWQDRNSNGLSEAGELIRLSEFGIDRIPLDADRSGEVVAGNRIAYQVTATGASGSRILGDAFLRTAQHARISSAR
ncbi:MAG: hypothetical protein ABIK09_14235 [Pseudomonadota bacterium]